MYLMINGNRHTCSKRIKTADTIKYLSVTPAPEEISGTISMYRDDGFLMCEDSVDGYERKTYVGTCLTVTNAPEPVPVDPTTTPEYRLSVLESENEALKSENKLLSEQVGALSDQNDFHEELIVELASIVYA